MVLLSHFSDFETIKLDTRIQFSFGEIGTSAPWSMLLNVGAHSRAPSDARYDGYLLDFDVTKRDDFAIVLKVSYEAVMCLVLPSTTRFVFVVG